MRVWMCMTHDTMFVTLYVHALVYDNACDTVCVCVYKYNKN